MIKKVIYAKTRRTHKTQECVAGSVIDDVINNKLRGGSWVALRKSSFYFIITLFIIKLLILVHLL